MTSKQLACGTCATPSANTTFTAGPPVSSQTLPRSALTHLSVSSSPAKQSHVKILFLEDERAVDRGGSIVFLGSWTAWLPPPRRGRHHARKKSLPAKHDPHRFHQI